MPHNVEAVIKDIDDVKDDLHDRLKRSAQGSMGAVARDAKAYISVDADWKGNLRRSISVSVTDRGDHIEVSVHTDKRIAPYAPFVELGTGARTMRTLGMSVPTPPPDEGTRLPPDFPYDSPDMGPGMVQGIIDWVETKPVRPENDDMTPKDLGFAIAAVVAELGNYAHPFLRPAWFDNELLMKRGFEQAVRGAFR